MNVSIFVVMNNHNAKWIVDNYNILFKQLFKIGLNITQFAVVEDLLGLDYKSFSKGLTIFVEDEEKKASELFGIVNKNSNWSFSGTHNEDYWEAMTNYSLSLADFDIIEQDNKQYLKIKNQAANYLREFSDLIINVVIDLDSTYLLENDINIYGFASNIFGGLDITSLSITSSTPKTLYYTDGIPERTHLVNVSLIKGGDV